MSNLVVFSLLSTEIPFSSAEPSDRPIIESSFDSTSADPACLSLYEMLLLERIHTAGPSDLDLAIAMNGTDLVTGSGIRNCCTLQHYFSVYFLEDDCPEELTEEDLKSMILNRPYLAIITEEHPDIPEFRQVHLIKNCLDTLKNADTLLIYDEETDAFQPLAPERIRELNPTPSSKLLFSNKSLVDDDNVEYYHAEPTPGAFIKDGFYHEKQKGGQCAVHALNAFFGDRIVSANLLAKFNRAYYGVREEESSFPPENQETSRFFDDSETEFDIIDSSEGNNPLTVKEYILDLAARGKVAPAYQNTLFVTFDVLSEENIADMNASFTTVDRCIVGYTRPEHFIAFRRDQRGSWFKVDSENPIQDRMSPGEFLSAKKGERIFLFYFEKNR